MLPLSDVFLLILSFILARTRPSTKTDSAIGQPRKMTISTVRHARNTRYIEQEFFCLPQGDLASSKMRFFFFVVGASINACSASHHPTKNSSVSKNLMHFPSSTSAVCTPVRRYMLARIKHNDVRLDTRTQTNTCPTKARTLPSLFPSRIWISSKTHVFPAVADLNRVAKTPAQGYTAH
eukprot:GEMP01089614.1.p1 GENE.GEMP01089614.1~~GEMP01089614.1.p1  ORF type:complete len:179 (+),score=18.56 GEMP01089614.1:173-709(+)